MLVEQEAVKEGTELVSSGNRVYHAHTRENNKSSLKNNIPQNFIPIKIQIKKLHQGAKTLEV